MPLNALIVKRSVAADLRLALSKAEKLGFLELSSQMYHDPDAMDQLLYFTIPKPFRESNEERCPRRLQMITWYDSFISNERRIEWIKEAIRAATTDL